MSTVLEAPDVNDGNQNFTLFFRLKPTLEDAAELFISWS